MCLCQANDGTIYYGEYYYNPQRKSMRIFQSKNHGDSWDVAYSFADGEINHIHGIFQDPYSNKLWVATGDDDKACIFGYRRMVLRHSYVHLKGVNNIEFVYPCSRKKKLFLRLIRNMSKFYPFH